MSLVVTKNIKRVFKSKGIKTSPEAIEAIDREVSKLCLKAADNVEANRQKIVRSGHIPKLDPLLSPSSSSRGQVGPYP